MTGKSVQKTQTKVSVDFTLNSRLPSGMFRMSDILWSNFQNYRREGLISIKPVSEQIQFHISVRFWRLSPFLEKYYTVVTPGYLWPQSLRAHSSCSWLCQVVTQLFVFPAMSPPHCSVQNSLFSYIQVLTFWLYLTTQNYFVLKEIQLTAVKNRADYKYIQNWNVAI